jgi:hypothetical protein
MYICLPIGAPVHNHSYTSVLHRLRPLYTSPHYPLSPQLPTTNLHDPCTHAYLPTHKLLPCMVTPALHQQAASTAPSHPSSLQVCAGDDPRVGSVAKQQPQGPQSSAVCQVERRGEERRRVPAWLGEGECTTEVCMYVCMAMIPVFTHPSRHPAYISIPAYTSDMHDRALVPIYLAPCIGTYLYT